MGRRRNNPDLVEELTSRKWDTTMGEQEYTEKYLSLSSSDMSKVGAAIDGMEAEFLGGDECDEDCLYERGGIYCPECHRGD